MPQPTSQSKSIATVKPSSPTSPKPNIIPTPLIIPSPTPYIAQILATEEIPPTIAATATPTYEPPPYQTPTPPLYEEQYSQPNSIETILIPTVAPTLSTPSVIKPRFSQEQLDYFAVTYGIDEFSEPRVVSKWTSPVRIKIRSNYTKSDYEAVQYAVDSFNGFGLEAEIVQNSRDYNIEIRFVPHSDFYRNWWPIPEHLRLLEDYRGIGRLFYNSNNEIYHARVLIDSTLSEKERAHYTLEEVFQVAGFARDTSYYPSSISYEQPSQTTEFSEWDLANGAILYHPGVKPGMSLDQVIGIVNNFN